MLRCSSTLRIRLVELRSARIFSSAVAVVKLTEGERNFHIFYQLCAGADEESRSEWRLKDAKYFNYLNQSSCFELNGVDNAKEYERTVQAMDAIGIDATERRNILSVLAGILHLGNVKFIDAADSDDDGCVLDGDNAKNALLDCAAVLKVDGKSRTVVVFSSDSAG